MKSKTFNHEFFIYTMILSATSASMIFFWVYRTNPLDQLNDDALLFYPLCSGFISGFLGLLIDKGYPTLFAVLQSVTFPLAHYWPGSVAVAYSDSSLQVAGLFVAGAIMSAAFGDDILKQIARIKKNHRTRQNGHSTR